MEHESRVIFAVKNCEVFLFFLTSSYVFVTAFPWGTQRLFSLKYLFGDTKQIWPRIFYCSRTA